MIIVTGTAPRAGTSAMMRALLETNKAHSLAEKFPNWCAPEKNPEGFWDISLEAKNSEDPIPTEQAVIKLWATAFHRVDVSAVDLVVVMRRDDFVGQVDSIVKTGEAQGLPEITHQHISNMFLNQYECVEKYFADVPKLVVTMEKFRNNPEQALTKIKEVVPWAQ